MAVVKFLKDIDTHKKGEIKNIQDAGLVNYWVRIGVVMLTEEGLCQRKAIKEAMMKSELKKAEIKEEIKEEVKKPVTKQKRAKKVK